MKGRIVVTLFASLLLVVLGSSLSPARSAPHRQDDDGVGVITVENAASVEEIWRLEGHEGPVFTVAFDHDSAMVASGSVDTTVRVWELATGEEKYVLEDQEDVIAAVAFTYYDADGAIHLLSAAYGNRLLEYDMADGSLVREHGGMEADPPVVISIDNLTVAFSADGFKFVDSLGLEVWDALTLRMYASDTFDSYYKFAWSGDGTLLVGVTDGNLLEYFLLDTETETYTQTYSITGLDTDFYIDKGLALNEDGTLLAIADDSTSDIQIYYMESDPGPRLTGHAPNDDGTLGVYGLVFNPDATLLVSASHDNTLRIWDVAAGEELALIETDGSGLATVAFSPDGRYIATGDLDGTVQVWGLPMP